MSSHDIALFKPLHWWCNLIPRSWWLPELDLAPHPARMDEKGWITNYTAEPARFYGGNLYAEEVTRVVIHCGSTGSDRFGRWFANPYERLKNGKRRWVKVSCHFSLSHPRADGTVEVRQHVSLHRKAYHAGAVANADSVGIELPGKVDRKDWPEAYEAVLHRWLENMLRMFPNIRAVHSHRSISPKTRRDPGPNFPWRWFDGLGLEVVK